MQILQESPSILNSPLFQESSILEREELMELSVERNFKKNQFIFLPEQEVSSLHLLVSGRVKTGIYNEEGKEIIQNVVNPGELFGEQVILDNSGNNEFAQAISAEVKVITIPIGRIKELVAASPAMGMAFAKLINLKLKKAEKRLQSMVSKNARNRIIDFIKNLAFERGRKIGYETLVHNYLTHLEIANLTATSRQTVTTVLNELKAKNKIYFDRKRILIRDLNALA